MLVEGRKRAEAERLAENLDWVVGDAMALPFADNSFDVYTISFGIRNVTRIADALKEAYRVLRPGGPDRALEPPLALRRGSAAGAGATPMDWSLQHHSPAE